MGGKDPVAETDPVEEYLQTLVCMSTPKAAPFKETYFRQAGHPKPGLLSFRIGYLPPPNDSVQIGIATLGKAFQAQNIPMIASKDWRKGKKPYPLQACELRGDAQYMVTGQLNACLFFVAEVDAAVFACHIQPGPTKGKFRAKKLHKQLMRGAFTITGHKSDGTKVKILPKHIQATLGKGKGSVTYDEIASVIGYKDDGWQIAFQCVSKSPVKGSVERVTDWGRIYPKVEKFHDLPSKSPADGTA